MGLISSRPLSDLAGRWRSRGYGWRLDLSASGFARSDVTAISATPSEHGDAIAFAQAFELLPTEAADTLALRHRGDVTTYWFDRDRTSPKNERDLTTRDSDPALNLEMMWRHMAEHYAFFELRGMDWDARYAQMRERLHPNMDEDALLDLCLEMVEPLKDGHVAIDAGERSRGAISPLRERKLQLQRAFDVPAWQSDRQTYTEKLQAAFNAMFLDNHGRCRANGLLQYGHIRPDIGYLSVFGEFGYADTPRARAALDLPRPLTEAASFLADEITAIESALDEAIAALRGVRALIIDARLNYGGYDRLALAIAARFTAAPRVAYRKHAFTPEGPRGAQEITITPRGPALLDIPIYLLTSRQTVSAGEILTLALSACPNVVRVGETTLGILSDNLFKRLPIGWELSLSNEIYQAADGALYESIGILPQVTAPVFDPADVRGGFRHAVETALALAEARR